MTTTAKASPSSRSEGRRLCALASPVTSLWIAVLPVFALLCGCAATQAPIRTEGNVDLQRFMGDWYVIASIPTWAEEGAHNAVESYRLDDDGTIDTMFTFRAGSFDGEEKRHNPRGFVLDKESNAIWGMQFVWPIKGDYRIVHVSDDYQRTIIGREKRDYVWIMARTPAVSDRDYQDLLAIVREQGYPVDLVRKVPQRWPDR